MIRCGGFNITFGAGGFHAEATTETGKNLATAVLFWGALSELISKPSDFARIFGVTPEELQDALNRATPNPPPRPRPTPTPKPTVMLPEEKDVVN